MKLDLSNIEDFCRGGAFLGAGGGGDPYIGGLLTRSVVATHGAPDIVDVDTIADDANVYIVAGYGAPTVMVEKLLSVDALDLALAKLEAHTGRKADALLSAEVGGFNSTMPAVMGAKRGLPVIDGDGMGRAFPELQMTTYHVGGIQATPMAMANEHGQVAIIEAPTSRAGERMARPMAMELGLSAMIAAYPMSGADAKRTVVRNTLSMCCGIGEAIRLGRGDGDPVARLMAYLRTTEYYNQCTVLFDGKVVDLQRETKGGFAQARVAFDALDGSGDRMEIVTQNEHLVARLNGQTRAIVPDIIAIVDRETADPITTEGLRYGQRVKILGVSTPAIMRSPEALAVFGPHSFGFDEPFRTVEDLNGLSQ